jgi:hypothetical protein
VGGILDADDALRLVDAGARLVQLYTGLVYRGPRLIGEIVAALASGTGPSGPGRGVGAPAGRVRATGRGRAARRARRPIGTGPSGSRW